MEAARATESVVQGVHDDSKVRECEDEATIESIAAKTEALCPVCYEEFEDLEEGCCPKDDESNGKGDDVSGSNTGIRKGTNNLKHYSRKKRQRVRVRVDGCSHEFCRACLAQQCKVSISRKEIPIPCPRAAESTWTSPSQNEHDDCSSNLQKDQGSEHFLSTDLVKTILTEGIRSLRKKQKPGSDTRNDGSCRADGDVELNHTFSTESLSASDDSVSTTSSVSSSPEYWKKYSRLLRLRDNPTLISCTKCEELLPPPLKREDDSPMQEQDLDNSLSPQDVELQIPYPEVVCPHCTHQFCSEHGDIHRGMTCAEFADSQQAKDMQQSEQAIMEMTKRCSHQCGARIALVAGCDHVICANCNQDMCYRCGTHEHLTGKVIRSCSGCRQGYVDHRHYCEYRFRLLFLLPLYVPVTVIYFAVAAVAFLLSCCCGCCFCLGTRSWDCQPRRPKETKSKRQHDFPEQSTEDREYEDNAKPPLAPGKGLWMVTQILCFPMVELARDCGWYHEHDDVDSEEGSSHSTANPVP